MTEEFAHPDDRAHIQALFKAREVSLERCLFPALPHCQNEAIRAHSVQNSRALDLLVEDGHVFAVDLRLDARLGPRIGLVRVGRRRATTFTGLCRDHDAMLFAAIDRKTIDLDSPEQCFLLAYRAAFWELHACGAVAVQMQTAYKEQVRLGLTRPDSSSPAGQFAVERMIVAAQVYRWKSELDIAWPRMDWSPLRHHVIRLSVTEPTVAASALFSIGERDDARDLRCVTLSIIPLSETETAVSLSFKPDDEGVVRERLSPLFHEGDAALKRALSRRVLQSCQNFVLAPRFVARWPARKRDSITQFFIATVLADDASVDDEALMLFA